MGSVKKYFSDIYAGISSTLKGMAVTFRHLGRKPVTVCHPETDVEKTLPEIYRGILDVNLKTCVSCGLCEKACPIECIEVEGARCEKEPVPTKDGSRNIIKTRTPIRFDIDMAKCMFCGFCSQICPTGAIHHTRKFSACVYDPSELTYRFVSQDERERILKLEKEFLAGEELKKAQAPQPHAPIKEEK